MRTCSRLLACLLLLATLDCGGGDDAPPGSVGTRDRPLQDAKVAEEDAEVAAPDAAVDAARPEPDDDAGVRNCKERECRKLSDACRIATCNDETDTCERHPRPDGTGCGDPNSNECDDADACVAGKCSARHHALGSGCGDQNIACHVDDTCDGRGHCVDNGMRAVDTSCGDSTSSDCDLPDSCDGSGVCQPNYAPEDQPCGASPAAECQYEDRCNATGSCVDRGNWTTGHCPPGHDHASGFGCSCGSFVETECRWSDVCVDGACVPQAKSNTETCSSGTECCDGDTGECCDVSSSDSCSGAIYCM